MTAYVTSGDERAIVEKTPDINTELSLSDNVIHSGDCTLYFKVLNKGESGANIPEKRLPSFF